MKLTAIPFEGDPLTPVEPGEPFDPVDYAELEPVSTPAGSIYDMFLRIILKVFRK